eukprot:COSAG02_NODE_4816_length_4942_cov_80.857526_6_plen_43_part_00
MLLRTRTVSYLHFYSEWTSQQTPESYDTAHRANYVLQRARWS